MKTYILYNPIAGHGNMKQTAQSLAANYENEAICLDLCALESYADFFAKLSSDDQIILCGGDGTLNRFVNDTEGLEIPCDILYCAKGTGNDFLHDLERSPEDAPFSVKEYLTDLPMVEVKGKTYRFLNNVGFGIDGYCCEVGDQIKQTSDKPVNYTSIAIKGLLFHFKPVNATITVDGQTYSYRKVWIAPTMKGRFYGGGMMPTPAQDRRADDGSLSLMVMHGSGKLKTLIVFPSLFKGEHIKHTEMIAIHQGKDITVTFDRPTALQIDGETILGVTEYRAYAKAPVKAEKVQEATV